MELGKCSVLIKQKQKPIFWKTIARLRIISKLKTTIICRNKQKITNKMETIHEVVWFILINTWIQKDVIVIGAIVHCSHIHHMHVILSPELPLPSSPLIWDTIPEHQDLLKYLLQLHSFGICQLILSQLMLQQLGPSYLVWHRLHPLR